MTKHFLTLADFDRADLRRYLDRAIKLKEDTRSGKRKTSLEGKILGLVFEKASLRTRVTFEVGMRQLGGDSIYLSAQEVQLGVRESVADVARNLERWVDGIVLRTFRHEVA
ncbi:MAG: ornithine carbamoyltransferase, partial [Thermodesulfobacteriota bacterium]